MSDNKDTIITQLQELQLTSDEANIYVELLHKPNTHLRLSHITGINRTKVYRLIENLEKRSLVTRHIDDQGMFLVATDPATLEVAIVNQEAKIKQQRTALSQILPTLTALKSHNTAEFMVRTYEGIEGLKQMVWHELKTQGELLSFGGQAIEDVITNHRWAEKHRALSVEAGYIIREIKNYDLDHPLFSKNENYMKNYQYRQLPSNLIYFNEQIIIYNTTVSIYHWRENKKVGIEIESKSYTMMMRQIFEYYWHIAK